MIRARSAVRFRRLAAASRAPAAAFAAVSRSVCAPFAAASRTASAPFFAASRIFFRTFATVFSALLALLGAGSAPAETPSEIVAHAAPGEWLPIPAEDLLVMELAPDPAGKPRRIVLQLMPAPYAPNHLANIRLLARAHWWDGTSINRVQDDYVVQWGDATEKKPLPTGLRTALESDYVVPLNALPSALRAAVGSPSVPAAAADWHRRDPYAAWVGIDRGWPVASDGTSAWPTHCYGMVGVGRNLSPDAGSGAELYVVIGQPTRQLDRNIAVVARVVAGIENLSSLPRGTGDLGFYEHPEQRVAIVSVRLASDLPPADRPRFEALDTSGATFARYVSRRANRQDSFYFRPAGGVDVCNVAPPIRPIKG